MRRNIACPLILLLSFSTLVAQDAPPSQPSSEVVTAGSGPWGRLEYYEVALECPDEFLAAIRIPSQLTEWVFEATSQDELQDILTRTGLSDEESASLISSSTIMYDSEIIRVFPSDETILKMAPVTRSNLYSLLALYEQNQFYRRPVYIAESNLSRWFRGTEVSRPVIEDIAKLAYPTRNGRGFYLSDIAFTLRNTSSAEEERHLFQALLRRKALIVRLLPGTLESSPEIASYWTAGYKNKEVLPLLESVVKSNEGGSIDIAHLLPPIPRQYLNIFPALADGLNGRFPDWFWTCYNFFRFTPRTVYANSPERDGLILREFSQTTPPYQFGDMILLNSGGKTIHGCIYIAEEIVYTKNGEDVFSPWVLMRIQDVVGYHDRIGDVSLTAYRKRGTVGQGNP